MNPTVVIFIIVVISLAGIAFYLFSRGREDPCAGTESAFRAWCDSCAIRNWPADDGASKTMINCIKQHYQKTISTCKLSRSACSELAGIG